MHNSVSYCVPGPVSVYLVGQFVSFSSEESDWHLSNGVYGDQIGVFVLSNRHDLVVRVRVFLESIFSHVLGVVENTLGRSTVGLVVHVYLESVFVVVDRVSVCDHFLDERAEEIENCACKASCPVSDKVALSKSMDSKNTSSIVEFIVENGSPLKSF